jgi:hypothetical protein
MIRADLYKGSKRLSNFIDRDAAPRKDDSGLIVDHGNVGFIPNADGHHPLGGRFSFPSFPAQGYGYTPAYDQRDHGYSPQGIYGGHAAAGTARPYQQGKKK